MKQRAAVGAAIGGALLFAAAGVHLDADGAELARVSMLGAALGALAYIDIADHRIPNRIVVPTSAACTLLLFADRPSVQRLFPSLVLVAFMLAVSFVSPASFGMGDVKLALLVVLGLGDVATRALVVGLVLAATFGALLLVRFGRAAAGRSLPLAPFLATGAALVVLL
jgi:leader peptidase (prepilin peptidase) / N-methyltransferase